MRFTRVEVHFESRVGTERKKFRAVILANGPVTGLQLRATPGNPMGVFSSKIPNGVKVFHEDGPEVQGDTLLDGPLVCYQLAGQEECW